MIIDENNVGIRIDKYLTDNTEYTRSKIQKMIDNGNILVNGKEVKSSYILKENDKIDIEEYNSNREIQLFYAPDGKLLQSLDVSGGDGEIYPELFG